VVEATQGCDINPGKCAKQAKSTKSVKQILSTYARIPMISKSTKQFVKILSNKTPEESFQLFRLYEILHAKRQGGGG
jgi:hypothetical protein